jgi:threonine 3-dehydrogenase
MAQMRALMKTAAAPGAEIQRVEIPDIGPSDVLVRVHIAAICGTDLHIYEWDDWSSHRIHPPLIFGHEFCGYVERVGTDVVAVKAGDFVSAEMHVACGHCFQCRSGQAHICQNVRILGVDGNGCFAEYVRVPESNIYKLHPSIPPDYAAILDPLGNAIHTVLAGEITGRSAAVVGCGPIGQMAIAVCRAAGAGPVFALEINEPRRRMAERMHADFVLDPRAASTDSVVLAETGGVGVDVALEFSGQPDGINTALRLARRGARVSLLGIPSRAVTLNLAEDVIFKGLTVQGINGRRMFETWFQMESLLRHGRLQLEPLFTDRLSLGDFKSGMERLRSGEASKVLLFPNGKPG